MKTTTESDIYALKTVCGSINYSMVRYNKDEIPSRDWEYFCGYVKIPLTTIYCIQVFKDGFLVATKKLSFRYYDHDYHHERKIQITYF
jgi:hypothetical protein